MTALIVANVLVYLALPIAAGWAIIMMGDLHRDLDESIKEANKNLEDK